MPSTNFIDTVTKVEASWLNDVNTLVYDLPNKTDVTKGSALVGHGGDKNYAVGTIGAIIGLELNVQMFPWLAACDGVTDDTAAVQAAINQCLARGGGVVNIPPGGRCLIDSADLLVKSGVHLKGQVAKAGFPYPYATNLRAVPNSIILNPLYTIKLASEINNASSAVTNLFIISKACDLSRWQFCNTDFVGTAITVGNAALQAAAGNDVLLEHLCILGFNQAIRGSYCHRINYNNIVGDNKNGIWLSDIYDLGRGRECHFFPFLSVGNGGTGIQNWRNGIGFNLDIQGAVLDTSFCFGYKIGFRTCRDSAILKSCWADANSNSTVEAEGLYGESYGFLSEDPSGGAANPMIDHTLIGCWASSHSVNFKGNFSVVAQGSTLTLQNCSGFGSSGKYHALIDNGRIKLKGCNFFNTTSVAAFGTTANTTSYDVNGCEFDSVGTVASLNATTLTRGSFRPNNVIRNTIGVETQEYVRVGASSTNNYNAVGGTSGYKINYKLAGGTEAAPGVVANGNTLGAISGWGHTGTVFSQATRIRFAVEDAAPGAASMGGSIIFATQPTGAVAGLVERLKVAQNGDFLPLTTNVYNLGTPSFRYLSVAATTVRPGAGVALWTSGAGSPEGVLTAAIGSLYTRTDGGANTTLYIKESGGAATGWVAK